MKPTILFLLLALLCAALVGVYVFLRYGDDGQIQANPRGGSQGATQSRQVPEGYQQIIPRGSIPAIDNPKYVTVKNANLSEDSFVLGVVVEGQHQCMTTRGIRKPGVAMITSQLLGHFRSDPRTRAEFLNIIGRGHLNP